MCVYTLYIIYTLYIHIIFYMYKYIHYIYTHTPSWFYFSGKTWLIQGLISEKSQFPHLGEPSINIRFIKFSLLNEAWQGSSSISETQSLTLYPSQSFKLHHFFCLYRDQTEDCLHFYHWVRAGVLLTCYAFVSPLTPGWPWNKFVSFWVSPWHARLFRILFIFWVFIQQTETL